MGSFFDDLYTEVVPIVAGAAAGYYAGPQAGQATERSVDRLINGRPDPKPPTIIQNLYQAGGQGVVSSERPFSLILDTPRGVPGLGTAGTIQGFRQQPTPTPSMSMLPWLAVLAVGGILIYAVTGR